MNKEQINEIIEELIRNIAYEVPLIIIRAIFGFLADNWIIVIIGFLILFLIAILNIFINYNWRLFSKILYRFSYLGILFVIILIAGIEILVNPWIKLILFIIGIFSFELVGCFLRKFGFR